MGFVTTDDDVQIFYKDWGPKDAQPIVFHHGWPLSSDDWDAQNNNDFAGRPTSASVERVLGLACQRAAAEMSFLFAHR
jgi:pimeloyl-ACP methyl ester carboxylesterase